MPWPTKDLMTLRLEFVTLAAQRTVPFRELAKRFNISAKTGYKWVNRYRQLGAAGLVERSRRPHGCPKRSSAAIEQLVVELRHARGWGGRHLSRALKIRGEKQVPAASTCTNILRRHGLIDPVESAKRQPFQRFERAAPNQLLQMDFKGHVPLRRGGRCHPLTVIDDHSRYCLGLEACADEQAITVQDRLTKIFQRYGIPEAMLTDNGAPWGHMDQSFTSFELWLMRLAIKLYHGRPHHPQTQGKDERFNRSVKHEVLERYDLYELSDCQQQFDTWRQIYNHERPHDSLDGHPPSSRYQPSRYSLPATLPPIEYPPGDLIKVVKQKGEITFKNQFYYIGRAFCGQPIALRPTLQDGLLHVFYCWQQIGQIDLTLTPTAKFTYVNISHP